MTLSVITPTFNRPERLVRALCSLQTQHHPDWEALVVDDGDGSGAAAARALGDLRVRALMNPGRGQVDARNAAVNAAQGEVVALLDDDDWWEDPQHMTLVLAALASGPALVHRHGWVVTEENGVEVAREPFALPASPESLRRDNTLLTSSLAYPRALHEQLGPFDPAVNGYFDWDWILRVLDAGYPLVTLATPGVCYLVHGQNGSAVVTSARRTRDFEAFCSKHALDIVIKSHQSLLAERLEPPRHPDAPLS